MDILSYEVFLWYLFCISRPMYVPCELRSYVTFIHFLLYKSSSQNTLLLSHTCSQSLTHTHTHTHTHNTHTHTHTHTYTHTHTHRATRYISRTDTHHHQAGYKSSHSILRLHQPEALLTGWRQLKGYREHSHLLHWRYCWGSQRVWQHSCGRGEDQDAGARGTQV